MAARCRSIDPRLSSRQGLVSSAFGQPATFFCAEDEDAASNDADVGADVAFFVLDSVVTKPVRIHCPMCSSLRVFLLQTVQVAFLAYRVSR